MAEFYISPLLSEGAVLQRRENILVRGGGTAGAEVTAELAGPYGAEAAAELAGPYGAEAAAELAGPYGAEAAAGLAGPYEAAGSESGLAGNGDTPLFYEGIKCFRQRGTVGQDGIWRLFFDPLPAGGPYCLRCMSGSDKLEIKDIWFGDVWVLAGQSNMQLPMERVKYRFPEEYRDGRLPLVRQFTVPIGWNFEASREELTGGGWKRAVREETAAFSAAGYFFGKKLFERYQVPVGLILTAVGGTPIQAWMSREALSDFPEELRHFEACRNPDFIQAVKLQDEERTMDWWKRLDDADPVLREGRMDGRGKVISLSDDWEAVRDLKGPGSIWLKKQVVIPKERAGIPVRISLGTITDADFLYVNGIAAGSTGYRYPPREYELEGLLPGVNTIVLRVVAERGTGGFTRGKRHAIVWEDGFTEDISTDWSYCRGARMEPLAEPVFFERKPVGMYQGMIAPLQEFPVKGICWYQGEMNTDEYEAYDGYFRRMVSDWRKRLGKPDLPVLFVQLPNYDLDDAVNWVKFREVQRGLADIPGTAMIVTVDCGEWNDLHPTDKKTVGERLAMAAFRAAYEDEAGGLCPLFAGAEKEHGCLRLHFCNTEDGLSTLDGKALEGFEYLSDTGRIPARVWIEESAVVAKLPDEREGKPVALVYGWKRNPAGANLCNGRKLPASPFRCELL